MPGRRVGYVSYAAHLQLLEIPWHLGGDLTPEEARAIARSVKEFQAGESSEGRHLIRNARRYAERSGDHEYVAAIRLFIAEEQRHARDLARVLTSNGIPLVRTTLTDRVFRWLRGLGSSLEVSIAVLITAEIIAEVYYAALREATRSRVLRRLCDQILQDEVEHVRFQAEHLARLRRARRSGARAATMAMQRLLFLGTIGVVWVFHSSVLRRAELGWKDWWKSCWRTFERAFATPTGSPRTAGRSPATRLLAIK